jgi:hypothetical protein
MMKKMLFYLVFACLGSLQGATILFTVVPEKISVDGTSVDVRVVAIVQSPKKGKGAKVIASNGRIIYTSAMRQFMKTLGATKSDFLPLEVYLKEQVAVATEQPIMAVTALSNYLTTGNSDSFRVAIAK